MLFLVVAAATCPISTAVDALAIQVQSYVGVAPEIAEAFACVRSAPAGAVRILSGGQCGQLAVHIQYRIERVDRA